MFSLFFVLILFLLWLFFLPKLYSWFFETQCFSDEAFRKLKGKTVLITGASSGLGKELAKIFFDHGSRVIMVARRIDELRKIRTEFMDTPVLAPRIEPIIIQMDLSDMDQTKLVTEEICKQHQIDILINNAGVSSRASAIDTIPEVDRSMFNVNYLSQITMTKIALKSMLNRKLPYGHILCVSSVQGRLPLPYRSSYGATKHALQAFYDSLRAELSLIKSTAIHVSVITPGYIRTNLSLNAMNPDGSKYGQMDASTASGYEPEYVAKCCLQMILNQTKELILAPVAPKIMIIARSLLPEVYFFVMKKYAIKQKPKQL